MPQPTVLQMTPLPQVAIDLLKARFDLLTLAEWQELGPETPRARSVTGIATTARGAVDASLMDALPVLRIIACYSAGTEGIDSDEAARRGISVTTTSDLIAGDVADLGMGMTIALLRRFPEGMAHVRSGAWPAGTMPLGRSLAGGRIGIVGLGNIGQALARRAGAFDMVVRWHGPRPKAGLPWPYEADLIELARWSNLLAICCPETPETRGLVSADVLAALGPEGYLVNIARGRIVDEEALQIALSDHAIAGAALDVFANEPHVPHTLARNDRVICLPHIGAATVEIRAAMAEHMVARLAEVLL
ncbi:D-3-phosphoglycerate dehydrogenase [Hyphomicrobiales bacterium]|nr:D-3-phosphoglycerate dehydrogenase [Hyphomicrobiales bacterium]CAH1691795.1 D-3-phosphoglycerate dehydrogenase [Hyphomicrobiales bacterium]